LADDGTIVLSCLHLGFYLASWGMMRGSGELLQRSVRVLVPVVQAIAAEPEDSWRIDVSQKRTFSADALALCRRIKRAFPIRASDTLVTKTVLGVFGCVPAFDRYFRAGFGCSTLCTPALDRIAAFYASHAVPLDAIEVATLNVSSGLPTPRLYPRGKLIDMVFFQIGGGTQKDP
jgi:hypothetical protein